MDEPITSAKEAHVPYAHVESTQSNEAGKELYTALLQAQRSIDATHFDAEMDVGGNKTKAYASTEGVMRDARNALHVADMVLIRGRVKTYEVHHREKVMDRYKNLSDVGEAMVVTYFRLAHAPTGQWLEFSVGIPATLRKGMPADKATGSAVTYATRYAAVGVLFLPRVEPGAEPEQHNDSQYQAHQAPLQAQQAPQSAPAPQTTAQASAQPSRGGYDSKAACERVEKIWGLIEELGDQPEREDLSTLATEPYDKAGDRIRAIGSKATGQLCDIMIHVEEALSKRGTPPDRPGGLPNSLSQWHSKRLLPYAEKLKSVANMVLHKP